MGEAKRKKQHQDALGPKIEEGVARVSNVLRKLAQAASAHLGGDCYLHASLGQQLLADIGIRTQLQVGFAAWRVGDGDGDVISHVPAKNMVPMQGPAAPYHAWLSCGDYLIDFTTYQLPTKAKELDAADGGTTSVAWAPDYLYLKRSDVRSFEAVAKAPHGGVAHYHYVPALMDIIGGSGKLDPEDLVHARILMMNPDAFVLGPNNLGA